MRAAQKPPHNFAGSNAGNIEHAQKKMFFVKTLDELAQWPWFDVKQLDCECVRSNLERLEALTRRFLHNWRGKKWLFEFDIKRTPPGFSNTAARLSVENNFPSDIFWKLVVCWLWWTRVGRFQFSRVVEEASGKMPPVLIEAIENGLSLSRFWNNYQSRENIWGIVLVQTLADVFRIRIQYNIIFGWKSSQFG